MIYISKEQLTNLTRYNNFRMNESMISIVLDYLVDNSLDYGRNGSYNYLNLYYKNNDLQSLKLGLDEEIQYLKKLEKDMVNSSENFSKEFKIYVLIDNILSKIYKFIS